MQAPKIMMYVGYVVSLEALGRSLSKWRQWCPQRLQGADLCPENTPGYGTQHRASCLILCMTRLFLVIYGSKEAQFWGLLVEEALDCTYSLACVSQTSTFPRRGAGACTPQGLGRQKRLCVASVSRPGSLVRSIAKVSVSCFL